jgi:hypothetical protein
LRTHGDGDEQQMAKEEQGFGVHNDPSEMFSRNGGRKFLEKFGELLERMTQNRCALTPAHKSLL